MTKSKFGIAHTRYAACNMPRPSPGKIILIAALSLVAIAWVGAVFWAIQTLLGRAISSRQSIVGTHHMSEAEARVYLAKADADLAHIPQSSHENSEDHLMEISSHVAEIAREYPDMPGVWRIAGIAIDKRFPLSSGAPPTAACGTRPAVGPQPGLPVQTHPGVFEHFRDCRFELDRASPETKPISLLQLQNVHVIYRGGRFSRMQTFACVNCTFDVQLNAPPDGEGRSLVRGILAYGSDNFAIGISAR
jgi:hypothetical protein